jgi:signal transduction histidine kinase
MPSTPIRLNASNEVITLGASQDARAREQATAEMLRIGQSRLLEMIAKDEPLEVTLDSLMQLIEAQSPGVLCSVLLMDDSGQHLLHGAAPSLPKAYCDAIHGVTIGEHVGSCGTAAFRRTQVIVSDIQTDPLWVDYAALAETYQLRACWSTPIISFQEKLLGTFAMYYKEARNPGTIEMNLIKVATDIAGIAIERRQKEQELLRYANHLEDLVNERTAELSFAKELAEASNRELYKVNQHLNSALNNLRIAQDELISQGKMAALGALVAGVAHELNTPIGNALITATTMEDVAQQLQTEFTLGELRKSSLKEFIKQTAEMAGFVARSCTRAASLIHSFKQVAIDQSSEQRRTFNLRTLVNDNIAAIRPSFMNVPWVIEVEIAPDIGCDSYPGPLGQVIANLVQNAISHGFEGRDHGKITISATLHRNSVEMVFSDDGKGMESAALEHIFDPFFTTKMGQGGSGLGLSISRNIATSLLCGTLHASSEPGKGASFILEFPLIAIDQASIHETKKMTRCIEWVDAQKIA